MRLVMSQSDQSQPLASSLPGCPPLIFRIVKPGYRIFKGLEPLALCSQLHTISLSLVKSAVGQKMPVQPFDRNGIAPVASLRTVCNTIVDSNPHSLHEILQIQSKYFPPSKNKLDLYKQSSAVLSPYWGNPSESWEWSIPCMVARSSLL